MSSPSISVMNCGRAFSARLALAPVVIRRPMSCELLDHCERHALRLILDGLLLGPVRGLDASTQVLHGTIWDINMEGADRCGAPLPLARDRHVAFGDAAKPGRLVFRSRPLGP